MHTYSQSFDHTIYSLCSSCHCSLNNIAHGLYTIMLQTELHYQIFPVSPFQIHPFHNYDIFHLLTHHIIHYHSSII